MTDCTVPQTDNGGKRCQQLIASPLSVQISGFPTHPVAYFFNEIAHPAYLQFEFG